MGTTYHPSEPVLEDSTLHLGNTMEARVERSTGGVQPIGIAGRMVRERERLLGMSAEERAWRAQYLKDQHLTAREPVHVPEYWRERYNPIRRLYRAPLNALHKVVEPIVVSNRWNTYRALSRPNYVRESQHLTYLDCGFVLIMFIGPTTIVLIAKLFAK